MSKRLRKFIALNLINYRGWCTDRKIVVIQSDDWGSIRMPSKEVYHSLISKGLQVDKCPYNSFDAIEDKSDLTNLFDVLNSVKDSKGNHPVITANTIVANPDFDKIRNSGFQTYHNETFVETYNKDERTLGVFDVWKEGILEGIFHPQFHGREHLNIDRWMSDLKCGKSDIKLAFDYGVFGLTPAVSPNLNMSYMAALDYNTKEEQLNKKDIVETGLKQFKEIFGFSSKSFIAPNYVWGDELNKVLFENGVSILQCQKKQIQPQINRDKLLIRHYVGDMNNLNQYYQVRNCFFEPSLFPKIKSIDSCLTDINNAFMWNKPAIISTHRLNFMGGIEKKNRDVNLNHFRILLANILKKWPNAEFLSTVKLGDLINGNL